MTQNHAMPADQEGSFGIFIDFPACGYQWGLTH
jgi:hypothetical protein